MNKTISINIGGQFFHIEEDAFTQLDHYINAIKLSIAEEGRDEIIDDIENRIAELFQQRITQPNGVIRKAEVEEIISIMGQPEDYIIDDNANTNAYSTSNETNSQDNKRVRKLYRDPDSKILGGVCSGIGHYFNIDPVWMRILFIVLVFFYGVSFLIYPILWIIIPKAVTPSQILEMKGIPVNINNIEKEVRESLGKYVDGSKRIVSSGTTFIKKFIGITLVIFGIGGIFSSGIIPLIGIFENNHFVDIDRLNQYIDLPISMYTLALVFFLTCAIPFFIILLAGIKLLYSKMKHTRWIIGILGSIWLISCLFLGYVILKVGINKDRIENAIDNLTHTEITHKTDLQLTPQDTLVINFQSDSRLYSNDSLSYEAYKKSNNIEIEFAQSTLGHSYVEVEEKKIVHSNVSINIGSGNYQIKTDQLPQSLPYEYSYSKPVVSLSKDILYSLPNDKTINWDTNSTRVKIKFYLKEGQLIKANGEDNRYYEDHLENGVQVYQFIDDDLQLVNKTL